MGKRKQPAARLIQSAWRSFVSEQEIKRRQTRSTNNASCIAMEKDRSVLWKRFETNKSKTRRLNKKEMNSLHFVFAVKLLIARRNFVKAFKPVDVRDVLEQYAAGHADMLAKVKTMDTRLDRIQNNINNPKLNNFRFLLSAHLSRIGMDMKAMQKRVEELGRANVEANRKLESMLATLVNAQKRPKGRAESNTRFASPLPPCESCGCHLPGYFAKSSDDQRSPEESFEDGNERPRSSSCHT